MSYEDMARSHVKELVREAFELDEVVVDADGDLPFPCGTAMIYLSVEASGRVLRVWSRAVVGVKLDKAVLQELNEANAGMTVGRVYASGPGIWVEACLPVETLRPRDVAALCHEVGTTADRMGSMLATVFGGRVALPEGVDAGHQCDD